ncbi:IS66 family insertion sequence element accessory protein TnpB [Parabacteroides distasonis]|uniref:IS66 family insertion sequence element accessory protein TnpB n=2 Tax=Parabacteroides distasonis TaxID=823 RepID=UPI00189A7E1C|nr:IS66 family insertion sequence element accessory protein TnpB [Parabacteroides distasonis]
MYSTDLEEIQWQVIKKILNMQERKRKYDLRGKTCRRLASRRKGMFFPQKRDLVKTLHWDTDGFILYQKRLESGTFELPRFKPDEGLCKLQWETFLMIIRGIPLHSTRLRKRFIIHTFTS